MERDFETITRALDPQRAQLERRAESRRRKVMRAHPDTGAFLLAMSDEPIAESAFVNGEPWQRWVAELLRESFPEGVFLFNRRRGAGLDGDIDVVAVLPSGVWAIDIQRFADQAVEIHRSKGGPGRLDFLHIDGVDQTAILDDVDAQALAVSDGLAAAGFPGVPVTSVLCLIDAAVSWRGAARVGTTHVTNTRPMVKLLAAGPVILDETDVASLGLSLDKQLARKHIVT